MKKTIGNLSGRAILVTGCSSGIGACIAQGLGQRGYRVIATCRNRSDALEWQEKGFEAFDLDLSNERSVSNAISRVRDLTEDRLYGLINNGAYGQPGAMIDLSREAIREQFETNVFGTQQLTNGIVPLMLNRNEGRVIQISSILGLICLRFRGAYNASKYALEAMTDTMRLEHRNSGVHFCLIEPGPIRSYFRQNALAKYRQHVDAESSRFRSSYQEVEQRLLQSGEARFTLPPEAVLDAVSHALEARHPKIRYPVTVPTRVMAVLKRLFPDRVMDAFLHWNSDRSAAADQVKVNN